MTRPRTLLALVLLAACARQPAPASPSTAALPASPVAATAPPHAAHPAEDRFVDSLLALMTVEEKVGQLNQLSGMGEVATGPGGRAARTDALRRGEVGSIFNVVGVD